MCVIFGLLLVFIFNSIVFINEVKSEFRIVGGVKALKGEFPHQALLVRKGYLMCSTSLIDHKWVVTAAHCVTINKGAKDVPEIKNKDDFVIRIGEYNIEETDSNRYDVNITNIVVHPKWNFTNKQNDIALIELSENINYTKYVNKIELSRNDNCSVGTISGWGSTGSRVDTIILRKANIPILDNKRCSNEWIKYDISRNFTPTQIIEGQICAGDLPDVSSCHGDSGGPLQCFVSGQKFLIGIVSFGYTECEELSNDLSQIPNVYTRISYYYDWIESKINLKNNYQ